MNMSFINNYKDYLYIELFTQNVIGIAYRRFNESLLEELFMLLKSNDNYSIQGKDRDIIN
jgi:hypothetical protein